MRVRCKQRITTTGLDIYFQKVKPGKGVNCESVAELDEYNNATVKKKFIERTKRLIAQIDRAVQISERTELIKKLQKYVKKVMKYDWYYEGITTGLTNEELRKKIDDLSQSVYAREDVYFRKVNFVYAFFAEYLVDEECIVTKDMVRDLIGRCNKVIEAAKEDGLINNKNKIINKNAYYYHYQDGENWLNITPERRKEEEERINKLSEHLTDGHWVEVAEHELPTQAGFFFGSTDYNIYYLSDVLDCKEKFEKLLKNWKDDEIVYNMMSW